jgi:glycosyltransferase involved in cell wall biosynthesis
MRIAHFVQGRPNPDNANGVDKTVYFLSRAQAARRHEVAVFALTDKPTLGIAGVEVRHFGRTKGVFGVPRSLIRSILEWRPDFVHLHSAYVPPNASVARVVRRHGVPYAITPNGVLAAALLRRRRLIKVPYKFVIERPLLNRAAFVQSVGDTSDIRQYGVRVPIVEAPNGFDPEDVPEDLDASRLRRQLNAGAERIALFLGRLDVMQKGLDLLLQALASRTVRDEIRLVLVGPDWKGGRERLQRVVIDLGLSERVVFWGPAFERTKFELLVGADFFVHVSRWEGLPFAVVEAMGVGKPCLVTDAADPLGLVSRYDAGRVVLPDADSIGAGLREMANLSDSALRAAGGRSQTAVQEHLSWPKIADRLSEAYSRYGRASR